MEKSARWRSLLKQGKQARFQYSKTYIPLTAVPCHYQYMKQQERNVRMSSVVFKIPTNALNQQLHKQCLLCEYI
jgi:hypothetical protein